MSNAASTFKLPLGNLTPDATDAAWRIAGTQLIKLTRRWLETLRPSGDGPSEAQRAKSWFTVTFRGKGGGRTVVTRVSGGDPGYSETSKMLAESALTLTVDHDTLPDRHGVLTPAAAMGDRLTARLQAAGIRFEVLRG